MQTCILCSGIFIVTLSFYLGMINAVLLNECAVDHFSAWYHKNFPGMSTTTTHLTSTSQPNTTIMSVILTTQPTKTSLTGKPTTASPVTSPRANITVVTTFKTSSTSVTGEFTVREAQKGLGTHSHGL